MKRVLSAMIVSVLATAGILVSATPAAAQELATCLVDSQEVSINTSSNTATIDYELYCPVIVGYEFPATAVCSGTGTGDRSSLISAWANTEDECVFSSDGYVIGISTISVSRTFVSTPFTGDVLEVGAGVNVSGLLSPSVQNSEVAGHFSTAGDFFNIVNNEAVPGPYTLLAQ